MNKPVTTKICPDCHEVYNDPDYAPDCSNGPNCPLKTKVKVQPEFGILLGDMLIRPTHNAGKIWIGREDGEGGEFDAAQFLQHVRNFYHDNF